MALKSDRLELQTDISFFYNAAATTRGCVVSHGFHSWIRCCYGSGRKSLRKVNLAVPLGNSS